MKPAQAEAVGLPTLLPSACLRLRDGRSSDCARCSAACPHDAIQAPPTKAGPGCDGCGLCAAACSESALSLKGIDVGKLALRIREIVRGGADRLVISCRPGQGTSLQFPCLGATPLSLVFYALAAGARQVVLRAGDCDGCSVGGGGAARTHLETRAHGLVTALGLSADAVVSETLSAGAAPGEHPPGRASAGGAVTSFMGRRAAFFGLRRWLGQAAVAVWDRSLGVAGEPAVASTTPRRTLLVGALRRLLSRGRGLSGPLTIPLGFGALEVDADRCSGCGACEAGCPHSALQVEHYDDGVRLEFAPPACTACGLCASACVLNALKVRAPRDLREALSDTRRLVDLPKGRCAECKTTMHGAGDLCWVCASRQCVSLWRPCGQGTSPASPAPGSKTS